MKKYIDREALLNRLEQSTDTLWKGLGRSWWAHSVILKDNFVSLIREAPTADVVEVVRCKDCVYWDGRGYDGRCEARKNGLIREYTNYDDFCSYGERKEQE